MGFNTLDLSNINLDDDNFYEHEPETIFFILLLLSLLGLLPFVIDLSNVKHVKKINEKFVPIA